MSRVAFFISGLALGRWGEGAPNVLLGAALACFIWAICEETKARNKA